MKRIKVVPDYRKLKKNMIKIFKVSNVSNHSIKEAVRKLKKLYYQTKYSHYLYFEDAYNHLIYDTVLKAIMRKQIKEQIVKPLANLFADMPKNEYAKGGILKQNGKNYIMGLDLANEKDIGVVQNIILPVPKDAMVDWNSLHKDKINNIMSIPSHLLGKDEYARQYMTIPIVKDN